MKKFFQNKTNVLVLVLLLVVAALLLLLFLQGSPFALYALIALIVFGALWIGFELFLQARKRRRQKRFDESLAAKEGIADRRREWGTWVTELEKQGIDRYDLPFYLLVGEPQSGKSILLQNSDMHFPFGQTRLSGVGGTRGCDWWFTDEAVILDLAGRLFTHEGGASDELEWNAFLELLADYRPLCPANGILLVVPCDGLLQDQRDAVLHKAGKIQNALVTLSNKLQAQLPVYVVLTKGDKIFGFAECVHRLEQQQRQQMFGWSRESAQVETPFRIEEARDGFDGIVQRARTLRNEMMATAALPEDIAAVHRMSAFPDELRSLWPNLELYLKSVFTDNALTERLFFRGMYLTSGLQVGAPIAKVCAELISGSKEADARALEALFVKQRAYFIRDLVREKVFAERGLVKPTSTRVKKARNAARVAYGASSVIAAAAMVGAVTFALRDNREVQFDAGAEAILAAWRSYAERESSPTLETTLERLRRIEQAILEPGTEGNLERTFQDRRTALHQLYAAIFDYQVLPRMRGDAIAEMTRALERSDTRVDHARFLRWVKLSRELGAEIEYDAQALQSASDSVGGHVFTLLEWSGANVKELRRVLAYRGDTAEPAPKWTEAQQRRHERLVDLTLASFDRTIEAGCPWQVSGDLGFLIALDGLKAAYDELASVKSSRDPSRPETSDAHLRSEKYFRCLQLARASAAKLRDQRPDPVSAQQQLNELRQARQALLRPGNEQSWAVEVENRIPGRPNVPTPNAETIKKYEAPGLEEVCDPAVLSLAPWNLALLGEQLESYFAKSEQATALGATPRRIINAKCAALGRQFVASVTTWEQLRDPHLFVGEDLGPEPLGIDFAPARRLLTMLGHLREASSGEPAIAEWAERTSRLLAGHIAPLKSDIARIPQEALAESLAFLRRATLDDERGMGRTSDDLSEVSKAILAKLLDALQKDEQKQWSRASGRDESVAGDLTSFLEFEARLADWMGLRIAELATIPAHQSWLSSSADAGFSERLRARRREFESSAYVELNAEWKPEEVPGKLAKQLESAAFESWLRKIKELPLPNLPGVGIDDLRALAKRTAEEVVLIDGYQKMDTADSMAADGVVELTRSTLAGFRFSRETADADLVKQFLAARQARAAALENERDTNAARQVAHNVWASFEGRMRAELRKRFKLAVEAKFSQENALLREVLLGDMAASKRAAGQYGKLRDQFLAVFRKDGVLDVLERDFALAGEDPLHLAFDADGEARPDYRDAWELTKFLSALQEFFAARAAKLESGTIGLRLELDENDPQRVWGSPDYENVFLVQCAPDAQGNWEADSAGPPPRMFENGVLELDWRIDTAGPLALHFMKVSSGRSKKRASAEVHTLFAPLLMAWSSATPQSERCRVELPLEFPPEAKPEDRARNARVFLTFKGGSDLPRLPERPALPARR